MDNRYIDVRSEGRNNLLLALKLAFVGSCSGRAVAYRKCPKKGLILYWRETERSVGLPVALDAEGVLDLVARWLDAHEFFDKDEPDHDGSNGRGWRVYNESWGRVGDDLYAFVAVHPVWAMYGK